ncbi:hypothetical protein [Rhodococcus sp. BE178]|uniref:hypothetical protein n=1 Tax=Rhodococcus sp. BE178 TaxID=2817737 RepID=UPI003D22FB3B
MVRWLISIIAVMGLAGALPLAAPTQAHACSCVYDPDGPQIIDMVSNAASVFTGAVTAEHVEDQTAFYEFEVREVFTGDIGTTTTVSSSVQGAACGRSFEVGTEYIVFTSTYETAGAQWSVNSCSATTQSSNDRTREAAVTVYGEPRPPTLRKAPVAQDGAPMTIEGTGTERNPLLPWPAITITAITTALAAILLYRRRRHHQR